MTLFFLDKNASVRSDLIRNWKNTQRSQFAGVRIFKQTNSEKSRQHTKTSIYEYTYIMQPYYTKV